MKNTNIKLIIAVLSFISAVCFGVAGLLLPPPGSIDGSVLILIAQMLVFCATLIGIQLKIDLANKYFSSSSSQINERLTNEEKDIVLIKRALEQDEMNRQKK